VWVTAGAFLLFLLLSISWARAGDASYPLGSNVVSALKFCEYALLAPAVALILRRPDDRRVVYWAIALWSLVQTVVAILQFLGDLNQLEGHRPNGREPAYLGEHDFAAFSGAALTLGMAALLLGRERALGILGGIAGGLGVALAAALDAVGGLWLTAVSAWALVPRVSLRRTLALAGICALVTVGAVTLRGSAIGAFLRFVGLEAENKQTTQNVQTYAHRTLLAYIGFQIWLHHPIAGVGWQESKRPHAFNPFLAGARKRFGKSEPPEAFPSPQHMWGVQNGVVQILADLGVIGLALAIALAVAVFRLVVRAARRGPPLAFDALVALGLIVFAFADITGSGLLAGLTGDSQLWIGVGLAVALAEGTLPA
jgi:hypothetical protein